jgi:hypothetical protein
LAAQDLVMHARGKLQERNWRMSDGKSATIDDISVFVIPLQGYKREYESWVSEVARLRDSIPSPPPTPSDDSIPSPANTPSGDNIPIATTLSTEAVVAYISEDQGQLVVTSVEQVSLRIEGLRMEVCSSAGHVGAGVVGDVENILSVIEKS